MNQQPFVINTNTAPWEFLPERWSHLFEQLKAYL